MVRDTLLASGCEDFVDTAELLVSEIVTNALVHAGTSVEVAFSFVDGGLRVEVTDGSPHAPTPRGYGPQAGTGRGLMLLEELVDEWGVLTRGHGKTVWFVIASHSVEEDPLAEPASAHEPGGAVAAAWSGSGEAQLQVDLVDVPLLLHEAWRQHAESLLREYLLASLDDDADAEAIEVHARASDAIALLGEHIPPSGVGEDPEEVMVTATEPFVTADRVRLTVPAGSVRNFDTLDRTLEAALELVDRGVFLSPPTQPEVQAFRAWLCGEVSRQQAGEAPTAWSWLEEPPLRAPHLLRWDTDAVSGATDAVLAADDADRVVAASPAAVRLLGYADETEIVGSRLVSVIPERYRQAHLAGFTMHFLTGRAPLVGRAVRVPALRRDGTEVEVTLTIHTDRTTDGRTVFVAHFANPAESAFPPR